MVHLQKSEAKRTGLSLEYNKTLLAKRILSWSELGLKFIWHPLIEIHELPHFLFTPHPNSSNVKAKALHCFYQEQSQHIVGLEFITLSQRPYLPAWLKGLHILVPT